MTSTSLPIFAGLIVTTGVNNFFELFFNGNYHFLVFKILFIVIFACPHTIFHIRIKVVYTKYQYWHSLNPIKLTMET